MTGSEPPPSAEPVDHTDDVPAEVVTDAKVLFPSVPRDLAVLVFDSLVDSGSPADDYELRFEHPGGTLRLDVETGPDGVRLTGRADHPVDRAELHRHLGAMVAVTHPEGGLFRFEPVEPGLIRICLRGPDWGRGVWTDWFRL